MKKLIIFILIGSPFWAQEIKRHSYYQAYNYYGPPFYYYGGYRYRKGDTAIAPYLGAGLDLVNGKLYATAGVLFREQRFFTDLKVVQDITPNFWQPVNKSSWQLLASYGDFTVGYDFPRVRLTAKALVGNTISTNSYNQSGRVESSNLSLSLGAHAVLSAGSLFYDDGINRIVGEFFVGFYNLPILKEFWYTLDFCMPMTFLHAQGWLELGLLPSLSYTDYFSGSRQNQQIGRKSSLYKTRQASEVDYFQFSVSIEAEYRLYFKNSSPTLSRFFIDIYLGIGYGKFYGSAPENGKMIYIYGGGLGYNIFDSAALQLQMGSDDRQQFVFNIAFISPITIRP